MKATEELARLSRRFGRPAAARKRVLLESALRGLPRRKRERRLLADTVNFIRAYPDDQRVLEAARAVAAELPDLEVTYSYSWGVVKQLLRARPGCMEILWDEVEDEGPLVDALELLVLPGEAEVMADTRVDVADWFRAARPARVATDLAYLVELLDAAALPEPAKVALFERCDLPIRYRGPAHARIELPVTRRAFQRREVSRHRFSLPPAIRRAAGRTHSGASSHVIRALEALCSRELEIYPLIYANPRDVVRVECGRGLEVLLIGVDPEWRPALDSLSFFLVTKNGAPMAYGPVGALAGAAEMGINLFPEFRGGETRALYAGFMRTLHHRFGIDYFYVTAYGMGEDNEDALKSGAFWFYWKLGFRPLDPETEALAQEEEARMAKNPRHRSDRRMLRRLSHSAVALDLSGGRRRRLDVGRLALAESAFIARRFSGDRARAGRRSSARMARLLGVERSARSLRALATTLSMIPDLSRWSRADRARLARFVRAKNARNEAAAARLLARFDRLTDALDGAATTAPDLD